MSKKHQGLDITAMAILILLCASWGLAQVAIKIASHGISPMLQAALRSLGAAVLVGAWTAVRREPLATRDGTLWWGIAAGLLFSGEFVLVYWGLEFTSASRAVIFFYMSPFVVALGAQLFIPGERLTKIQVAGLCCAFAGILAAFGESMSLPSHRMLIGDVMLAGAAVLWGATTVLIKASPLARIAPSKTLLYQLIVSTVILSAGSLAMGERGVFLLTPAILGCVLYQVVWIAFITYLIWFWMICEYSASRLASFTFLTPLFGVMAGGLLLNEPITRTLLLALVLVGSGIYLVNRPAADPGMDAVDSKYCSRG